jgi:hypothetical protein
MIHDRPDHDAEIAAALKVQQQQQARYDAIKYSGDSSSIIDAKFALNAANRRVLELRGRKEADRPVESVRNSSIFFSSNQ